MKLQKLQEQYDNRFGEIAAYRNQVWQLLISEFFQTFVGRNDAVLDLGCGWGEFINNIVCGEKFGMDLNPRSREKLHKDVRLIAQDCSQPWDLPDDSLDLIFTSNFFEHLPDKEALNRALDQARRCLKRNGRMICMGPNIRYLKGSYWDFYDHYLPLTHLSLKEGLELHGFKVETCLGRFLPYRMSGGRRHQPWMIRLYLKCSMAWWFFGKQFLLMSVKP